MIEHQYSVIWDWPLPGGEGTVFPAVHLPTGRHCALKFSNCTVSMFAREQLRFERNRGLRVRGNRVVRPVAWDLTIPFPFIVFEWAPLGSLAEEMRELQDDNKAYHPRRALHLIREILLAVAQVHRSGMVHRDVKPANILRFNEALKIADFGIVRTIDRSYSQQTRYFKGTRKYAAPEQINGWDVDHRVDLYAVGVILYEMLTCQIPPVGGYKTPPPSRWWNNILPSLDSLVMRLIALDPDYRPQTAVLAIREINDVLEEYDIYRYEFLRYGLPSPY